MPSPFILYVEMISVILSIVYRFRRIAKRFQRTDTKIGL